MTFNKSTLFAINVVVLGLMVVSYYFPFLRYFIFIPLLVTCVSQLLGWFYTKQKFGKKGLITVITAVFSVGAYATALCYPDKILYVCGALLIFMTISFFVGRTIEPDETIPVNDGQN